MKASRTRATVGATSTPPQPSPKATTPFITSVLLKGRRLFGLSLPLARLELRNSSALLSSALTPCSELMPAIIVASFSELV